MKKAVLIILSIFIIACLFSVTALAAPAESILLRAGGSIGGGGGGGFGSSYSRRRTLRNLLDNADEMTGKEFFSAFGVIILAYIGYAVAALGSILIPIIVYKRRKKARNETRRLMAEYDDFDGFWSYDYVQNRINEVYFGIQNAWCDGDMKKAEGLLTEHLFNQYQKHLNAMKRDGERNVMKNIQLRNAEPVYAKDFTHNEHDYLWVRIEGSMIDYVINKDSGEILQGTKEDLPFVEYWKFSRSRDGNWVLAEIMQQEEFEKTRYYKGLSKL